MPHLRKSGLGTKQPGRCHLNWLVALALLLAAGLPGIAAASDGLQTVEIATGRGVEVFRVELARTDEERARGLMFRRALPEGQGMLFDFRPDKEVAMWMKDTFIPLDMIFIRADGSILRIEENTTPHSTAVISSGGVVRAVLELRGGAARKYGIKPGDKVSHPLFSSR